MFRPGKRVPLSGVADGRSSTEKAGPPAKTAPQVKQEKLPELPEHQRGPLVIVGDIVVVPEADYHYGLGPLRLRVTEEPRNADRPGAEWIELTGREVWYDQGEMRDGRPRTALVRVSALLANPPYRTGSGK